MQQGVRSAEIREGIDGMSNVSDDIPVVSPADLRRIEEPCLDH
jgi:hypothetical protein